MAQKDYRVATGTVAFESLREHDVWQGKSTGKFNVVLTLDQDSADELEGAGVKVRQYEGNPQRKFTTGFNVGVLDADGNPYNGQVTRGSKVKVLYTLGNPNPLHGTPTYLEKVKVVELAEPSMAGVEDF